MFLLYAHKAWAWLKKAWAWFKTNWYWVVVPVGVVLYLLRRRSESVVAPELIGASEVSKQATEEAERKASEALIERDQKLAQLQQEHAETIKELNEEQQAKAETLKEDPAALNEFLLDVGKQMRH
jgi:hypothetical protein